VHDDVVAELDLDDQPVLYLVGGPVAQLEPESSEVGLWSAGRSRPVGPSR
jgi:hypothetical protein